MVAVFDVVYDHAGADNAPGPGEVITNLRFNAEDTNDQDLLSPLVIPSSGTIFSFWKQIYLLCTTQPDTQVNNVKLYSDGDLVASWGSGIAVQVGDGIQQRSAAQQNGYDLATGQDDIITHSDITTKRSLFSFNSGDARPVSISEAGAIINLVGETTDYIVLQTDVTPSAVPGTKPQETITWQYDEI